MADWSLLDGAPLMVAIMAAGAAGLLALLSRRRRTWWTRAVPVAVVATGVAMLLVYGTLVWWWRPFPDALSPVIWFAITAGVFGIVLAVVRSVAPPRRWWRPPLYVVLAAVVVLASAELINVQFAQYPTVRSALGLPQPNQVALHSVDGRRPVVRAAPGDPLADGWRAPPGMPAKGAVSPVSIPGTVSHFAARPGWIYLPPAYLAQPRAELPVLVLVNGQPGNTDNWLGGGDLAARLDAFAAQHAGLAPVVVIPDDLTRVTLNPMCLDSRLGNAFTYLTQDVPNWITSHLQVDPNPRHWAFGGFSNGGTCALQLAVTAPHRYPTFLDLGGDDRPSTGTVAQTISDAFAGDAAAYHRVNPLDILARQHFPGVAGQFAIGVGDPYRPATERAYRATGAAGMDVRLHEAPGGHSWTVWGPAFTAALPWLAQRQGLLP
jgi:S-formylglutathione hydrolase FrmB